MKSVAQIYDENATREWKRLESAPFRSIEFLVTMDRILKYLPKTGKVLDTGGGPGRYTIELCRRGYQVVLLDLSEECLNLAKKKILGEPKGVQERLMDLVAGDIRNLSGFVDNSFEAVLCLDPLSYLCEIEERRKAASELVRVTKPGGVVCIAVRGYLAVLRHMLKRFPQQLLDDSFNDLVRTGDTFVQGVPVHFFRAQEVCRLTESIGLVTLEMCGCEGLSTGLEEATDALAEDTARWACWMDLVLKTASEPAVVDMAPHMLYIGRKPD